MPDDEEDTIDEIDTEPKEDVKVVIPPTAMTGITLETYLSLRSIPKGHRPGMVAFAMTKHEVTKRMRKTETEWDALYTSY